MQDFMDVLDECGFHDLGFEGGKFIGAMDNDKDR